MPPSSRIRQTNRQLRTAQSAWTAAGKALTEFEDRCQKIGKSAEQVGKTLTRTVTTPIVGLGTAAVKASLDFESSFAYVRKTVNGTEGGDAYLVNGNMIPITTAMKAQTPAEPTQTAEQRSRERK